MMPGRRPWGRVVWRGVHVLIALCASAAVLGLCAAGFGPLPALGRALDPGHGAWTSAAGGQLPGSQSLGLPGLTHPVSVSFTGHGVPSIHASGDDDAFLALGYVHARFRLSQMDLERRLGEGRVSELAGPSGLRSDRFELRLGLLRTAQREWAATPRSSPAARALLAYSRGVNDYLAQVRADGDWPSIFSLTGVYPRDWTPVDSLVLQVVLTQELDYTDTPLDYALLDSSLGPANTAAWFPVLPVGPQSPYDPGPYRKRPLVPLPATTTAPAAITAGTGGAAGPVTAAGAAAATAAGAAAGAAVTAAGGGGPAVTAAGGGGPAAAATRTRDGVAKAAAALLDQAAALPATALHRYPDSNAWAANGPAVSGAKSMLAGDPHLLQTVPSIWYQAALSAPGLSVSGVTVPGLPGVLIGHNAHIAWSLTDVQDQSALFYVERTSPSRPNQYFWHGAWRRMAQFRYTIPVRGGSPVSLTVDQTVHGPVMTQVGQTTSVDWTGDIPSPDLTALLGVDKARDFGQFRAALADWYAPTQNFVYADDHGNIGAISAGYYPVVQSTAGPPQKGRSSARRPSAGRPATGRPFTGPHCQEWLPMPGTGSCDVTGVIPYRSVPQVYDPPDHIVVTANQRPVGPDYPYYIGTSSNFYDPGYRANRITALLRGHTGMTPATFASVQTDVTDTLAQRIVPRLLATLHGQPLSAQETAAAKLLAGWHGTMTTSSAAASVWWTFWGDYLNGVFGPWWAAGKVPVHRDRPGLAISPNQFSLDEVLAEWTVHDHANSAFTPPGGQHRTAPQVMRAAFAAAVTKLTATLHGAPSSWTWGRLHTRHFPSLTQAAGLGYGPRSSGSDAWTVDAADGGLASSAGPSWRMIVAWTGAGAAKAQGIYPGGQSENPASPWYTDQIDDWWDGRYLPMPPATGYTAGPIRWIMRPSGAAASARAASAGAASAGAASAGAASAARGGSAGGGRSAGGGGAGGGG